MHSPPGELDGYMALLPESPTVQRFGYGGQGRRSVAAGKRRESLDVNGLPDYEMLSLVPSSSIGLGLRRRSGKSRESSLGRKSLEFDREPSRRSSIARLQGEVDVFSG
jgi:hypothetical protein